MNIVSHRSDYQAVLHAHTAPLSPLAERGGTHFRAVVDAERLQRPGQAQAHQDVKHITANGVGDGHVPQT